MNAKSNKPLIPVEDALAKILSHVTPLDTEWVPLTQSLGRILAEPITSAVNVPPFANSAMDGYAIVAADSAGASAQSPRRLQVVDNIPAGVSPTKRVESGAAARIMTGAPMPPGADAVIRFEETSEYIATDGLAENEVALFAAVKQGDNVRHPGEDIRSGQTILPAGHRLRPQDVGVLAAVGQARVPVYRRPKVAILATGDELVSIEQPVTPGKIRNSNEYVQAAMVEKYGGQPVMLGIARDTIEDLTAKIRAGLEQDVDLFLTSAGVSIGDFDMVKTVLASEGQMQFWQVAIKPGKPLAFGMLHHRRGIPLIGLPGNPVAAMVAFEVFARPAILKLAGCANRQKNSVRARLDEEVTNSGRRHYMRAYVYQKEGEYHVTTRGSGVNIQGSGILSSMVWANGLAVIPENVTYLPAGHSIEVWILD
ncbi:MAG: molybdopterin molybdenumtransferase MoeA [Chloroflexi bacterium]|nr:MAG: molybdopterin molybdenumtransferase MoeA [Chloroflexota bacterium]